MDEQLQKGLVKPIDPEEDEEKGKSLPEHRKKILKKRMVRQSLKSSPLLFLQLGVSSAIKAQVVT